MSLKSIMSTHAQTMSSISNKYAKKDSKRNETLLMAINALSLIKGISENKIEEAKVATFASDKLNLTYDKESNLWYGSNFSSDIANDLDLDLSSDAPSFIPLVLTDSRVRAISQYYHASGEDYEALKALKTSIYDIDQDTFIGPKKGYSKEFNEFLKLTPDAQTSVVEPYVKNVKDNPDTQFYPGKNGDTLVKKFDSIDQDVHLNQQEAALIDLYGEDAEKWLIERSESSDYYKENQSHPIHEETGNIQLYSGGFGNLGTVFGGIGEMAATTGTIFSGGAAAGIGGAIGAMAGPASLLLMGADWIGGASSAAEEARKKQAAIEDSIKNLEGLQTENIRKGTNLVENLKEGTEIAYKGISNQLGTAFGKVEDVVSNIIKKSKGLKTGAAEQIKSEATDDLETQYSQNIDELFLKQDQNIEKVSQETQSGLAEVGNQINTLQTQWDDLEDENHWTENLI